MRVEAVKTIVISTGKYVNRYKELQRKYKYKYTVTVRPASPGKSLIIESEVTEVNLLSIENFKNVKLLLQ